LFHNFFKNLKKQIQNPHPARHASCRPPCCAIPATRASSRPQRCSCSRGGGTSSPVRRKQGRQACVRGVHAAMRCGCRCLGFAVGPSPIGRQRTDAPNDQRPRIRMLGSSKTCCCSLANLKKKHSAVWLFRRRLSLVLGTSCFLFLTLLKLVLIIKLAIVLIYIN
jgi:hypothetical protein